MTILKDLTNSLSPEPCNPSHWMRRRAATGLKIEQAALQLFLDAGPENVTVEDIATEAGISRRTFFRYFRTKGEILAAMPTRQMLVSSQAVCQRPAEESLIEAILSTTKTIEL